jgi:hypothetical protein
MKNGLLIYERNKSNIFNIGDYIQSLAAFQFFGNKDSLYLNREHLNEYDGEEIKLIVNGWFMHQPQNWPPSSKIHPLFISFHINSLAKEKMLTEKSINYFKRHEPIGCRDYDTASLLNAKGVAAYFSGCLTLTLGKSYTSRSISRKGIYFVDVHHVPLRKFSSILKMIGLLFKKYDLISKLSKKNRGNKSIRNLLSFSFFYSTYNKMFTDEVLINAEYIQHEIPDSFDSEEQKFEYAECLLKKYSEAQYVVTSRIHCALPCLSMETPVLYVENVNQSLASSCRLKGLRELFHIINYNKGNLASEFVNKKITSEFKFKNKELYQELYKKLRTTLEEFANCR